MGSSTSKPKYPHLEVSKFPINDDGETITLSDGRLIGFKEYKFSHKLNANAKSLSNQEFVILSIPGLPGSRFFTHPSLLSESFKDISENEDKALIRLIVLERPGLGLSTFAKRNFIDFSNDIREFCQQKNIKKFSLLAYSAGGPFGLAAAYVLGKPIDDNDDNINEPILGKVAIISSVAPYNVPNLTGTMEWKLKFAWWLAKNNPNLLSMIARSEAKSALKNPVKAASDILSLGPSADKEVYEKYPEIEELFVKSILELYSRGQVETECWEYNLWGKDWGFNLSDIGKGKDGKIGVKCKVWHGEEDYGCTVAMGKYIADQIEGLTFKGTGCLDLMIKDQINQISIIMLSQHLLQHQKLKKAKEHLVP
ncbi:10114_t:CDS:2 [Scutellospora calospora]|uniref:10114_t:CDS:1 n=1 Tax=Scutellospora calospora TaxID=85575 RepID=A0ACA9LMN6_9GLOM|nr:10114_t:CDS:2 [Scutellospora calospora]